MNITKKDGAPDTVRTGWPERRGNRTVQMSMVVSFGLHYIKGNSAPYFSITADGRESGRESFGGACHDLIAKKFPGLQDVIDLHLSDMDGVPSYPVANGWYWLAGAAGGLGEKYHGGSGDFGKNAEECLEILARHLRVTEAEARGIVERCTAIEPIPHAVKPHAIQREEFARIVEGMVPRWNAEAAACIEKYGLTVYGDKWAGVAA